MERVTLFKPAGEETFDGAHNVSIRDGVLTFYYQPDSSLPGEKKITTSVPFLCEEDIGGH